DGDSAEIRRHCLARSRAGPAGVAVEQVRVPGLAAAAAPATGGSGGPEVGPFAEVGLAQQYGAGLPEPGDDEGIFCRFMTLESQRAGRGLHLVAGVDIVF